MPDTKRLIELEAASVQPRRLVFEDVERSVRRRSRRRRIGGAAVGIATTVSVFVLVAVLLRGGDGRPVADAGPNYEFHIHGIVVPYGGIRFPKPSTAGIDATVSWTTNEFPGVHRCTSQAFGEDGSPVGADSFRVVAMSDPRRISISLEVTAPPAKAVISCDPERLDVGEPYAYRFGNARVEGVTRDVVADGVWLGPSAPGAVTCRVEVLGPGERLIAARDENVYSARHRAEISIRLRPNEVFDGVFYSGDPASFHVRFGCRPFDGASTPSAPEPSALGVRPLGIDVIVLNATPTDGLATGTTVRLERLGYRVVETSNFPELRPGTTVYFSARSDRARALEVAALIGPEVRVEPLPTHDTAFDRSPAADLVVVLGKDATGSRH